MHWNYRLMKKVVNGVITYGVHEVYYEDGDKITSYTIDPETVETVIDHCFDWKDPSREEVVEELSITLNQIILDISNPKAEVLDLDNSRYWLDKDTTREPEPQEDK